ncbi:magnesium-dependent phosphatase-1 [Cylindrobasidium torrendii FP15055 ss-10]|uniref:Magnesium-dependent phosphatase-1 n=1 Tax=Cylindrobasidium torrendii FP15055 ss-10 TaxID=1314674 RepID=A0A0D7BHL4_9AGAR|nr:magnesium-dependent phosphatase-1 [Cylindrobasidium torrendii FP15055 ss-10]
MTTRMPKLVAFDLDYTLWDLWIDTHVSGPLHRHKNTLNEVLDKHDTPVAFYRDVPQILHRLRKAEITVAAASRTSAPNLARQALNLLLVPNEPGQDDQATKAIDFFDELEIYPGSKITHFKRIHQKTGIPYEEMLFFDDEHRNKEVEALGVTMCLVPNGVNHNVFEKGLSQWRTRYPAKVTGEDE